MKNNQSNFTIIDILNVFNSYAIFHQLIRLAFGPNLLFKYYGREINFACSLSKLLFATRHNNFYFATTILYLSDLFGARLQCVHVARFQSYDNTLSEIFITSGTVLS